MKLSVNSMRSDPDVPARPGLILASTSRYRRELLGRILRSFETIAPEVDESPLPGESPTDLARRLAREKARDVANRFPGALVIGSDQVAELDGIPLGKPGSRENARRQLTVCSGRMILFHTAVCVVDTERASHEAIDTTCVRFRRLPSDEIERYLDREEPYDCAGSFKSESLGIALFDAIDSSDPTALVGLPLIATCRLLRAIGIDPLG